MLNFIGALMGFMSVAMGAFGAHALKEHLSQEMLSVFEIGARYQMYHALAIFIAASISPTAGWLFVSGTIVFSGSLYLLAFTGIRIFGAITPIGGVLLLLGWGYLAFAALKA